VSIQASNLTEKDNITAQGPDLQRILRQTYDSAALTPDLRRACELRAINLRKIYAKLTQNLRKTYDHINAVITQS